MASGSDFYQTIVHVNVFTNAIDTKFLFVRPSYKFYFSHMSCLSQLYVICLWRLREAGHRISPFLNKKYLWDLGIKTNSQRQSRLTDMCSFTALKPVRIAKIKKILSKPSGNLRNNEVPEAEPQNSQTSSSGVPFSNGKEVQR